MRSVLMALVVVWCSLMMLQPVLLGQQSQDNWDQRQPIYGQGTLGKDGPHGYDVFYPFRVFGDIGPDNPRYWKFLRKERGDTGNNETTYRINAFGKEFLVNLAIFSDFLSPGFIIQRVKGNYSWLEEITESGLGECFYSGKIEGYDNSEATLSLCNGMRGIIHLPHEKYIIEPLNNASSLSRSVPIDQLPHIIYRYPIIQNQHTTAVSNCSVTENYKHHRLKWGTGRRDSSGDSKYSIYHKRRQKRSASLKRYVETLVVADSSMHDYYNKGDSYHGNKLEQYVLTLMAMVTSIYKHPSIGNFINIVVVKLILLEKKEDGPNISSNAATTLKAFCKWQSDLNSKGDSNPNHHDTAILLTRIDICRAPRKCDTLGLAELGTICDPVRSCSIVEDNGISAAYTVAHELGHVFNLPHDDDSVQCSVFEKLKSSKKYHVMAPTLDHNSSPWDWSRCSASLLTEFIDAGLAECLLDKPKVRKYKSLMTGKHRKTPGQLYSIDRQCELVFGEGYILCPHMQTCERLWCTNKTHKLSGCRTQHMPWADGTDCMDDGNQECKRKGCWCKMGNCVSKVTLVAVNGHWGSWQSYGACSRDCGGGIKSSMRECNNPRPANGGRYCLGRRVKYRSCNTKACPPEKMDFREAQCANFSNKYHINGLPDNVKWVPKYSGVQLKDACKLFCRATLHSAYYQLADKVKDGTKCGPDTDDICVNGKCRRAGCDNRLGSKMKRDRCGVCGGDNSSCRTITGSYNNAIYGYNRVVTIPVGATNINVTQHGYGMSKDDDTYLAMKNAAGEYVLNGDFTVRTENWNIKIRNGFLEYSGANEAVERINSTRIIGEEITIDVLSVGQLYPPNIIYSYTVSTGKNVRYKWSNLGPWKKCSRICQGQRKRKIVCIREDDSLIVSSRRCKGKPRPERMRERCNADCIVQWKVINEEDCPVHCGAGLRRRLVHCMKTSSVEAAIIDDKQCRHLGAKPNEYVTCEGKCLPTYWTYTDWSKCNQSCGGGKRVRQAKCVAEDGRELPDKQCQSKDKILYQSCNEHDCPRWRTSAWTGCSVSCGEGQHHRKVWCTQGNKDVADSLCIKKRKPSSKKPCRIIVCPEWFTGGWGPCSVTCGKGESMRAVGCRTLIGEIQNDSTCDASKRPMHVRMCYIGSCPTQPPPSTTTTVGYKPRAMWRYGSWTECSATCGPGTRNRYVSCINEKGEIIDNAECGHTPQPKDKINCTVKPCGQWRLGDWSECPVSCGGGNRIRYVACIAFGQQMRDERMCDFTVKPITKIHCNRHECPSPSDFDIAVITSNNVEGTSHWRVGPWTSCSSTCNTGWQRRQVVCQDEQGRSDACDDSEKPDDFRTCNSGPCPHWKHGKWSKCSSICGKPGYQSRVVACQLPTGQDLAESNCEILYRPPDTRLCTGSCNTSAHRWLVKPWSTCSVTCGRGQRHREVICVDPSNNELPFTSCPKKKPRNTKRCNRGSCPRWHTGVWSQCSVTCGRGLKYRNVICRDNRLRKINPSQCKDKPKPEITALCTKKKLCSDFSWKPGSWTECSKTCGFGRKERSVTCINRQGVEVSSHLCDDKNKPKSRRRCSEYPCPYIWSTSPWSQCSSGCGEGQQSRTIVCQAVTREGWILPGEIQYNGCKKEERPPAFRYCNLGDCGAHYHWMVGRWGDCSAKCGTGKQHRMVICVNRKQQRKSKSRCVRLFRPLSSQPCYNGPCYARSCKELKELTTIRRDGDYKIMVGHQLVTIYCKNMRKPTPLEYLTLLSQENFAEVFEHRLKRPENCPNNGTRPSTCKYCRKKTYKEAGNTTYTKIRIDLNSLKVFPNDGTFTTVRSGKLIPYGTAGDCYSSSVCPQGRFSINLAGTGFIVSVNTTWVLSGNRVSQRIWRLRDGEIIRGICGGYCGLCSPDMQTGLQLQLYQ